MSKKKPILFCFCGPTASGKSSICEVLSKEGLDVSLSISTTTRARRDKEQEGVHYYFVSRGEFEAREKQGRFLEHAEFGGNLYGTEKTNIERAEAEGKDVIFDIEVQGIQQLKALYPEQTVTIFVFPKSFEELKERLLKRGTETEESIKKRLDIAKKEIAVLTSPGFSDYLIVNDSLEESVELGRAIISAERARFLRQEGISFT